MQFQITEITFDFEDDNFELSPSVQLEIYEDYIGTFWEADDEDDLVEEITCAAGFCIKSIDYRRFDPMNMNRSELQDQLIQQIIDDMDIKTMAVLLYDMMDEVI